MSVVTALARIDEIQQRIQSFAAAPLSPTAAAGPSAASSASAGAFATAVQQVLGTLTPTDGTVTGEDIVTQAKAYLGVPYVFGGEDETGMDCSGLVQRVLADLGIDAPRVVQDQADIGVEVGSLAEARPGDLLVTNGEKHIVIYAGDGKIIHAPSPGKNVELRNNYLTDADIQTIRRVVPPRAQPAAATSASASAALFAAAAPPAASVPAITTAFASRGVPSLLAATSADGGASLLAAMRAAPLVAATGTEGGTADAAAVAAAGVTIAAPAEAVTVPPPTAAAAPATRTPFAQQVAAPVLSLARAGDGEHTLTLTVTPENLGPVTVKAQISGASITIELATPSDTGREALRALLVDLRRDLAGLAPGSVIVLASSDASSTGSGQQQPGAAWSGGSASSSSGQSAPWGSGNSPRGGRGPEAEPAATPAPAPTVIGSGIDLFA